MVTEYAINQNAPENWRADFPILQTQMNGKPLAFLDSGASAQKPRQVIDAMTNIMEQGYSNIHRGLYKISQDLTTKCEETRCKTANFIGAASNKEIIFTRNSTESINLVAQSWARKFLKSGDEIIITDMEHHANIVPWQLLRDQIGIIIKVIPSDTRGVLDMQAYKKLLSDRTRLVACVHTSNSLGTINPVDEIIKIAKSYNADIKTLIDGSQSIVHQSINVQKMGADFFCFTGHKLYGPSGIGVLYAPYEVLDSMDPYQGGGDMIEHVTFDHTTYKEPPFRFEAGTPAIVEIIGLGAAIDYLQNIGMEHINRHENNIAQYAHGQLTAIDGLTLHGTAPDKAGIFSFIMEDAHISDIGMILDQCGVAVRAGHHCCMPLMQARGIDGTIRASIGMYTNKQDIDQLCAGLNKVKELL